MNKINFDGRLLEGKDIQKKIHDIAYEMDFSGKENDEFLYTYHPKKYYRKYYFIHTKVL